MRQKIASFLSLFGSLSSMFCCALPVLLVILGAGAVFASMISALPWLVTISRYKEWVFLVTGILLVLNFVLVYRPQGKIACVIGAGKPCEAAKRWNKLILFFSAIVYVISLFVAYGLIFLHRLSTT